MICEVLPELPELPEHCQHASEHGGVHAYLRLVNGAAPPGKGGRLVAATVEDGPNLVLLAGYHAADTAAADAGADEVKN